MSCHAHALVGDKENVPGVKPAACPVPTVSHATNLKYNLLRTVEVIRGEKLREGVATPHDGLVALVQATQHVHGHI